MVDVYIHDFYSAESPSASKSSFLHTLVIAIKLWAPKLRGVHVSLLSDNTTCVSVLSSQHASNCFMQPFLQELRLFLALHNIQLIVRYVSGSENWLADALSRFLTGDYSLFVCSVPDYLLLCTIDCCASPSALSFFFAESSESLMDHSRRLQSFAFQESTKATIRTHLNSYLLFCTFVF